MKLQDYDDYPVPGQEHVWREGGWVCETIFPVYKQSSGNELQETHTFNDGVSYTVEYYLVAFTPH